MLPALSVTLTIVDVVSFQPIATIFVLPAACDPGYVTGTVVRLPCGVAAPAWTKTGVVTIVEVVYVAV